MFEKLVANLHKSNDGTDFVKDLWLWFNSIHVFNDLLSHLIYSCQYDFFREQEHHSNSHIVIPEAYTEKIKFLFKLLRS